MDENNEKAVQIGFHRPAIPMERSEVTEVWCGNSKIRL
jgi:hypothetical protein